METIKKQLIDILSYASTNDGVEKLLNNNLKLSINVVNDCLTLDDEYLAEIFMKDKYNTVFMMITKLSLHLLSNIKNLKVLECDHLFRIGLLTIKIMHNQHIYTCMEEFYDAFFRYRFQSNNLTECLLEHIQNITDSSLIRIVCLWLDIVVHYQHVVRKQCDDLKYSYFDPSKIISECIIKQKYHLPSNSRLRGSFLFYLTFIPYPHINLNEDEKLASICRQHMLSQMKYLNEWTSDTIHCVMGSICLVTKHFTKQFKYDTEYSQSLLRIVTHAEFHQSLVSTWTNDKTILIHTITEYFYENIDNNGEMKVTLSSAMDKLHKLYENVEYRLTKMNLCYLILVSTNKESKVSDEILLACFQYIKRQYIITRNQDIELGQRDKILQVLKNACHYNSIKDAIIRLNKINELVDLIRYDSDVVCDILALLSTKRNAQEILKTNHKSNEYMNFQKRNVKNRGSLETLPQNIKFSDHSNDRWLSSRCVYMFSSPGNVDCRIAPVRTRPPLTMRDQVVLSCSNTELAKCIKIHIEGANQNIFILNTCNNDMEKEKLILSCKSIIVCLTNNYHQFQSELILGYKNQVTIVPIVIEDEEKYCPKEPFLKFILQKYSSSLIRTNINELKDSLAYKTEHAWEIQVQSSLCSFNAKNYLNDTTAHTAKCTYTAEDLYKACKENEISKVKEYLQNIDIKILNERISNGSTSLHIASYNGHTEIVRLLVKAGASRTIRSRPYDLTPYEEARTQSTKDLFRIKLDNGKSDRFNSNDVYIEWMTAFQSPDKKRIYLREKLNQLEPDKDNSIDDVYKELVERMHAYIDTLSLINRIKQIAQQYFIEMRETFDPVYIIKAYTSATGFHKYYNEFIAQHAIDFFDPFSVDIHVDYSIVKCLMETIAIIMHSNRFYKYRYYGQTYRGMIITERDLYKYIVKSKIMNKSFLSTSKSKELAGIFSDCAQENLSSHTPDKQGIQIAAICTYIIKNPGTALDLETISEFGMAEREVLILPFSIFEVKSVQRSSTNKVHIELEEVSDEL